MAGAQAFDHKKNPAAEIPKNSNRAYLLQLIWNVMGTNHS